MKKTLIGAVAFVFLAGLGVVSCDNAKKGSAPAVKAATAKTADAANLPNYRYVDLDTVLTRYNLAKDYNEEMLKMQSNFESTARQKETSLRNYAASLQRKYQNNTYLTSADQQAIQAEQQKLASMENQAKQELAGLQSNIENADMKAQKTFNDSITAFIQRYNATKGYDAILIKTATLYINPALDITDEVVEGLNAGYNKVKK